MAPKKRSFLSEISANRGVSCEVSQAQKAAILATVDCGTPTRAVAEDARVDARTITRHKKRWSEDHTLEAKPRSGRPRYFDDRSLRQLKYYIRKNARATYNKIRKDLNIEADDKTIRSALDTFNIGLWRAAKRIPLTEDDAKERYGFSKEWSAELERLLRVGVF